MSQGDNYQELAEKIAKIIQRANRESEGGCIPDDVADEYVQEIMALPEFEDMYDAWRKEESYSSIYDAPDA